MEKDQASNETQPEPVGSTADTSTDDLRFALDPIVRREAIRQHALSDLTTIEDLLAALGEPDGFIRGSAVIRLISTGCTDPRALPAILSVLAHDEDRHVRAAAALHLCDLGPIEPVVVALRAALADVSSDVRWSSAFSLFQLDLGPEPGDLNLDEG